MLENAKHNEVYIIIGQTNLKEPHTKVCQYYLMAHVLSFWWRMTFKNIFRIYVPHMFSEIWCGRLISKNSENRPTINDSLEGQFSFKFEWNTERIAKLNHISSKFNWICCRKNIFEVIGSYFATFGMWKEWTMAFQNYIGRWVRM